MEALGFHLDDVISTHESSRELALIMPSSIQPGDRRFVQYEGGVGMEAMALGRLNARGHWAFVFPDMNVRIILTQTRRVSATAEPALAWTALGPDAVNSVPWEQVPRFMELLTTRYESGAVSAWMTIVPP